MKCTYVCGGYGFLGSALFRQTIPNKIKFIRGLTHHFLDYKNFGQTKQYLSSKKYDAIINCAAKVAGLGGHKNNHKEFLIDNTLIGLNILETARINNIKTFLNISSIAAFPYNKIHLIEDIMLEGRPHESEIGYSLAKRIVDEAIQLCRKEEGLNYCSVIPVNLYGPSDNFNLNTGHLIPSLIHKFYLAIKNNTDIEIWGNGLSVRQFLYVDDAAKILIDLIKRPNLPDRLIIARPETYLIKEVVEILCKITGFTGNIVYNTNKPNGLKTRQCSIDRMTSMSLETETDLEKGLILSWEWFNNNYELAKK